MEVARYSCIVYFSLKMDQGRVHHQFYKTMAFPLQPAEKMPLFFKGFPSRRFFVREVSASEGHDVAVVVMEDESFWSHDEMGPVYDALLKNDWTLIS